MAISRKKFREIYFVIMFSKDFLCLDTDEYIKMLMKIFKTTKKILKEAISKSEKIQEKITTIDKIIMKYAEGYKLDRISKIELTILRCGIFELQFDEEIPKEVAITEAIRLSKKFGNSESSKFINAIMDHASQEK